MSAEGYKVGTLADIITKHSQKNTKVRKRTKEEAKLASLFDSVKKEKKIKKRKLEEYSETHLPTSDDLEGYNPPPGIVHEALIQKSKVVCDENENQEEPKKKKKKVKEEVAEIPNKKKKIKEEVAEIPKKDSREKQRENRKKFRDRTADSRTVFVGNWPVSLAKKSLEKYFKVCGKIENVRFRCPPPKDPKIPKKVIAIKKEFHPERPTIVAFVCFKEEQGAYAALNLNGQEVEGHHIRVDLASNEKKHNHKCSVFVGNLSVTIDEETVWNHFSKCGKVASVRIIRDNKTGLGKGFCYVLFESSDSVSLAMKMNGSKLGGRETRVMRSQENPVKTKKSVDKKNNSNKKSSLSNKESFRKGSDKVYSRKEAHKKKSDKMSSKKNFRSENRQTNSYKGKSVKQRQRDKKFKKSKTPAAKKIKQNKEIFNKILNKAKENAGGKRKNFKSSNSTGKKNKKFKK